MDFKLEVGAVSQSIEVIETGAPLINTDNGTKGEVMTDKEIIEMPLNGRNINDLGFLVAGVTANTTNLQGSSFAINGARADNTNFILDGFGPREPLFGGALTSPNLDALSCRNILDGPGTIVVNQTVYRNFRFKERNQLQFRWEVFNVLNHANFQLPINNVAAANAGTLTSVVSPGRQMQFGARLLF